MDAWLIARLEDFSHWLQVRTGKTNFWLAQGCALLNFFILLAQLMAHFQHVFPRWLALSGFRVQSRLDVFFAATYAVAFLWNARRRYPREEREAFERLAQGFANPKKKELFFRCWRIILLSTSLLFAATSVLLILGGIVRGFVDLYMWAFTLAVYLESCDPLPPSAVKLKQQFRLGVLRPARGEMA